jgi:predicted enzyme related to lactoylglutathione lyase
MTKGGTMPEPVTYIEVHSPDLGRSRDFFTAVFDWDPQPFAAPDYLVAPATDRGIDTALLASRDGQPRAVPVIRVASLEEVRARVERRGGHVVVEPFAIAGVGRGCYITDPAGVLVGLHEYDATAV